MTAASVCPAVPDTQWDQFATSRGAALHAQTAWARLVSEVYGIRPHYLASARGQALDGILALFEIRHPLFGHYLTTAAFGTDGGLHADTPEARDTLLARARALAAELHVGYLVIRTRETPLPGAEVDDRYRTAILDHREGTDAVWRTLSPKTRNQIRRGQKEGFTIAHGADQAEAFSEVFQQHMRDLGSPAHSLRYYRALARHLGPSAHYLVVRDQRTVVAGALLLASGQTAMNVHTVALRAYNRRCPNYLLYWDMIERSAALGCVRLDMGRSEVGSSQLAFKANWNTTEVPLFYNYFRHRAAAIPKVHPGNPRYRLAIGLWQHLPLALTTRLGPRLISGIA